ncbi:hypothetical protein ASG35_03025 [Burkholderia sp. Leaf177]|nr:hypothetical protein ASG35_03025 [Burkholderia sp. Leaf177]
MDEVNAKKAGWIAAREKAIALSSARVKQAKALQAAIDNMAVALRDFETANDAALVAIYQATAGAAPKDHQAMVVFGQRAAIAPRAVTDPLRAAFVMALHDSGFGEVGLSLDGMLTYQNHQHLAHGNRDGLVAAVKQSTQAIDDALTDVHKLVGVIAPDPVIEFEPTIVSPDDPNAGVIPAVEWGAPAVPAIGARLMPSGG